jgi:dihydrofolate reductase
MHTIVWAALTANGNYAKGDPPHPPRTEALRDFARHAQRAGNCIVGRRTFERFRAEAQQRPEDSQQAFAHVRTVVVSKGAAELPGATRVDNPAAALAALNRLGYKTALVAGGETLINAFLAEGLVDEIVLTIAPEFESDGLRLRLPHGQFHALQLLNVRELGGGVAQLRYARHQDRNLP